MYHSRITKNMKHCSKTNNNEKKKKAIRSHSKVIATIPGKRNNISSPSQSWVKSFSINNSKKGTKHQGR